MIVSNGEQLQIAHVGDTKIGKNYSLPLRNIPVAWQIQKNSISVYQLTKDYSSFFEFDAHGFSIKDLIGATGSDDMT